MHNKKKIKENHGTRCRQFHCVRQNPTLWTTRRRHQSWVKGRRYIFMDFTEAYGREAKMPPWWCSPTALACRVVTYILLLFNVDAMLCYIELLK